MKWLPIKCYIFGGPSFNAINKSLPPIISFTKTLMPQKHYFKFFTPPYSDMQQNIQNMKKHIMIYLYM